MSLIFDYEYERDLVPYVMEKGEKVYEYSWDSGVFTFIVDGKKLHSEIRLTQDGVERILDISFQEYFVKRFLDQHELTHTELKEEWQPWNKLVIYSQHKSISFYKESNDVEYSLVELS